MESYFCEAVLCISAGCVLVGGMIAFVAFGIWKFMKSMKDVAAPPQKMEFRLSGPFSPVPTNSRNRGLTVLGKYLLLLNRR